MSGRVTTPSVTIRFTETQVTTREQTYEVPFQLSSTGYNHSTIVIPSPASRRTPPNSN